ncbi:MAG: hypothetical protein J5449_10205, partial [Oscillospiraceae bacterium]|nr:hypothetical protein [Oscillospiraceae bacterium]
NRKLEDAALSDEQLDGIVGGAKDSFNGIPLYDWTAFATVVSNGVTTGPNGYLTIRYAPDGPINHNVGGWGNGEQVRVHPYYTMNGKDAVWRWCYRNGFYGWVNGRYLA